MLGALDPLWLVADIYRHTVKVRGTPSRFGVILCIVPRAFVMAFRAFELNVLVWSGMNENSFVFANNHNIGKPMAFQYVYFTGKALITHPRYRRFFFIFFILVIEQFFFLIYSLYLLRNICHVAYQMVFF